MIKTSFDPRNAQHVLERAMEIPTVDLPLYLEDYGDVLPGLSEDRIQILTRDELNALPKAEALQCRVALVKKRLEAMKNSEIQEVRKTA